MIVWDYKDFWLAVSSFNRASTETRRAIGDDFFGAVAGDLDDPELRVRVLTYGLREMSRLDRQAG